MPVRLLSPIILALAAAVPSAWENEGSQAREYAYGTDASQRLDLWRGKGGKSPLILYIHGGGWSQGDKAHDAQKKADHFAVRGYAFASMNYRLVPQATVEQQAADVASAIAWVRTEAKALGIDPRIIILMGHSAGAHLAALVATDPVYLTKAGVPMKTISGVVLLDGAAFDVPTQLGVGGTDLQKMRRNAFGNDVARQKRLSPISHAARPNAGPFLILHVNNPSTIAQSRGLGESLQMAGTQASVHMIANSDHMRLNRNLGEKGDPATKLVDDYVARVARR